MVVAELNSNPPGLSERTECLVKLVNQLIADIESDIAAPALAAFHAKSAFDALCHAHNELLDAAAENRVRHYQELANDAQQVAA